MKGVGSSVAFLCLYRGCGRVQIFKMPEDGYGFKQNNEICT